VQHLDAPVDQLVQPPGDGTLAGSALPPRGDVLRLVGQRQDEPAEDRMGVAYPLLAAGFAALVLRQGGSAGCAAGAVRSAEALSAPLRPLACRRERCTGSAGAPGPTARSSRRRVRRRR
jgi:hypothetical protein